MANLDDVAKVSSDLQVALDTKQAALETERAQKNAQLAAKDALIAQKDVAIEALNKTIEDLQTAGTDPAKIEAIYLALVATKEDLEKTPVEVEAAEPTEEETEG